jgi:NAD(P)-dependent dehydrogenase (short-subunit alcohol dehydrogenase family)
MTTTVIVGGSSGLGRVIAQRAAERGERVILTSRDAAKAATDAGEIGHDTRGRVADLARPETLERAFADIAEVDNLVITAVEQGPQSMKQFDVTAAIRQLTVKLVGYAETVRLLVPRFQAHASIVLFGGLAMERPYPGSTMVTTMNGGISGLMTTLAVELAPIRVNALHAGVVGDSPKWKHVQNHPHIARTPIGRLVTMDEVAEAAEFLLRNRGVNAIDLFVDGGVRVL